MIISDIRELASLDFSVTGVTAKSERWTSRPTIDYSKSGRPKNLIHIITSGIRAYLYDGEEFELSAGTVLLIPEGTKYTTWAIGSCSGIGSLFAFTDPTLSIKPGIYRGWNDEKVDYLGLFTRLNDSWLTDPAAVLHRKSLVMRILDHMANDLPTDRSAGQLSNAVDFISAHFRENLPISDYAAACSFSESYFRRRFVERFGISPIDFRNDLRFREVRRMCSEGVSLSKAAEAVGFCDASYLRRLYKKRFGVAFGAPDDNDIV